MILVLMYFIIILLITKELKLCDFKERFYFWVCTFLSCIFAIIYRTYLINEGIEYGLANLDMQYYMSLADKIQDMSINDGFATISAHWNFANVNFIQIWGYRFYIYFLSFSIFKLSFFPTVVSVYLVSIWQLLLAAYSVLKIYNTIKNKFICFRYSSLILMLSAPPIWYACVRLLREPFMLLLIALLVSVVLKKNHIWLFKTIILLLLLTVFRPYYAVLMIPLLLILDNRIKLAFLMEGGLFVILAVLSVIRGTDPISILGVVLSPNFFNQVKNVVVNSSVVSEVSGEIPLISFIGSIWNIIMLYYIGASIVLSRRLSMICWCCMGIILDICMIYGIAFAGATELRHKMFFVLPFILILNSGALSQMESNRRQTSVIVSAAILANFLVGYALITCLIY